jgi:hypothetical protein
MLVHARGLLCASSPLSITNEPARRAPWPQLLADISGTHTSPIDSASGDPATAKS